jgi:hypothetical protein
MESHYSKHCDNLRALESAISSIQITLRDYISRCDERNSDIYTKILAHLVNSWVEVRILKLIYEEGAFSEVEIKKVIKCNLNDKWKKSLEIAYRKGFCISNSTPINDNRYSALLRIIDNYLLPSSQMRNRLAHGQWVFAFKNSVLDVDEQLTTDIRNDNILKIQLRFRIFKDLSQIIHDLAVSAPTFERDFDKNFGKIKEKQQQLINKKYDVYVETLVSKRLRGEENRL